MYSICSKYLFFGDPSVLIRFLVRFCLFDLYPWIYLPHITYWRILVAGKTVSRDENGHVT